MNKVRMLIVAATLFAIIKSGLIALEAGQAAIAKQNERLEVIEKLLKD